MAFSTTRVRTGRVAFLRDAIRSGTAMPAMRSPCHGHHAHGTRDGPQEFRQPAADRRDHTIPGGRDRVPEPSGPRPRPIRNPIPIHGRTRQTPVTDDNNAPTSTQATEENDQQHETTRTRVS